ncbi:hypothetical protein OEM_p200150 (plasmid) [Mycobacterium intracellulare subsp. yongonense 05-1390]|uniref:FitA-like ribbon-helix-helix domain-containing protein n=1 Tax=Mycobacterium TaxID=1763 RepID=UPI0002B61F7C|nr:MULTISPECIES: hypothetical protein [Mycobacterium]AFV14938.1 hypothetical protein OEM_p200150 [Mycobacterium intracellulare subsp. yongonense 05-1390]
MAEKRPNLTQRPSVIDKDKWVHGDTTATPAATVTTTSPTPPPPREPTRRLTLDIPERLHRAMKIRAATTGVTMLDEVRALLEAHYADTTQQDG